MDTFCNACTILLIAVFLVQNLIPFSHSVNFQLSRFSPDVAATVLLIGDGVISDGEIELSKVNYTCRIGQVIYNGKVPLWGTHTGRVADFTTRFSFIVDTQNYETYGHGLVFFLAPAGFQVPLNSVGGYLGLFNTTTDGSPQTQIVSVEFDTFPDDWDPKYAHLGINNNLITSSTTTPWNVTLHDGAPADAWITYNATSKNLSFNLSYSIDLLPQWVMIGISAATGSIMERHILNSWDFTSSLDIKEGNGKKVGLVVGSTLSGCVLIALALKAFLVLRKRRDSIRGKNNTEAANLTSINDDLERGAGKRRYSYKEDHSQAPIHSPDHPLLKT